MHSKWDREGHGVCVCQGVVGVDLYPPDLHLLLVWLDVCVCVSGRW